MQLPMSSAPMLIDSTAMREFSALLAMPGIDGRKNVRYAAAERKIIPAAKSAKATGVLPLVGMLEQHQTFMGWLLGGTDLTAWAADFDAMVANPNIARIVIPIDSPGGTVPGVPEVADKVFAARSVKPIIAVATPMAASAAYWIGSQASQLLIQGSGAVGSIGVYSQHVDVSKQLEEAGVTVTTFAAPDAKAEWRSDAPLSDDARAHEVGEIQRLYSQFVAAVARGRGVSASDVRANFGRGRTVDSATALRVKMVDGIGTAESVIAGKTAAKPGFALPADQQAIFDRNVTRQAWVRHENRKLLARQKQAHMDRMSKAEGRDILRTISGYVVRWGQLAWYNDPDIGGYWETVARGAFDSVLNSNADVVFTKNHTCYDSPIARRSDLNLDLAVDPVGLLATVRLPYTAAAYALAKDIDAGLATGWSCTGSAATTEWKYVIIDGKQVRLNSKVGLSEVCLCISPSQPVFKSAGPILLSGVC